jgi:hypothetical protein
MAVEMNEAFLYSDERARGEAIVPALQDIQEM